MSLARLSVNNPVPVNLLMVAIILLGAVSLVRLPRELMSDISFNWVFIAIPYPGVSAEEIVISFSISFTSASSLAISCWIRWAVAS